ncbi:molybdopterin molybdotransferase MoeA [Streptomyces phyllanthi]|uniref:Molybdopterin molybdenumtransferase n=1 Tax=Streptomyces phyllanthi TaxID=1803180 RepID=A0A5N8W664_9ACTN|nr:molybdopterin molybdotransferase MoeA [Streptomyces phyllanthi]MPY42396.1 molybdopterin molybdotransferase MoeA [Streptomyces phyllanthi]
MTRRDAEELDVEEALAVANDRGGRPPGAPHPSRASSTPRSAEKGPASAKGTHHGATPWPEARALADRAARSIRRPTPVSVTLDDALGLVLAAPLTALTDLPSFDSSAMDGWAVAGPGPWQVRRNGVLAGHAQPEPLTDGEAVRIATGARVPPGATAVLRSEHGRTDEKGRLHATLPQAPDSAHAGGTPMLGHGQDIRPRGQECRSGDQLLPLGTLVTPAVLGLAAAAGYDTVTVHPRPRAEVLVLGDELLTEGRPRDGLIRDALGPMLPPWLRALGAEVTAVRRIGDDADALYTALKNSSADLIVTTGGTAAGPVDHVHPTLRRLGAELLVDGVQVRPGHPMLLAHTGETQHLVGLPGNPLAAVSGLLTLAEPLLRTLAGRAAPEPFALPLQDAVHGHPHDTRLIPVALRADRAVPLHYNGPAMLRGIAAADALAVVPPGGGRPGQELELLDLPWAAAGIQVCFT